MAYLGLFHRNARLRVSTQELVVNLIFMAALAAIVTLVLYTMSEDIGIIIDLPTLTIMLVVVIIICGMVLLLYLKRGREQESAKLAAELPRPP